MQFYLQTFRHIFELRRLVIVVMATAVSFYMTARTIKLVGSWKRIGRQLKSARHGRQKAKKLQIAKVITRLLTTRKLLPNPVPGTCPEGEQVPSEDGAVPVRRQQGDPAERVQEQDLRGVHLIPYKYCPCEPSIGARSCLMCYPRSHEGLSS